MRIVVTGATGLLGGYVAAELRRRRLPPSDLIALGGPSHQGIDLADERAVHAAIDGADAVIHCAALSAMADCANDPNRARVINVEGTRNVAGACNASDARLVHVSTDLVFNGEAAPYRETDSPSPVSVYGRTKLEAESAALAARDAVVVRVSLLFGPTLTSRRGFFDSQVDAFRSSGTSSSTMTLFEDEWRTPLSLQAAAEGLVALTSAREVGGVVHFGGLERLSRLEMGERLRDLIVPTKDVVIRAGSRLAVAGEPRPRDVSLDSTLFRKTFPKIATKRFEEEAVQMMGARTAR